MHGNVKNVFQMGYGTAEVTNETPFNNFGHVSCSNKATQFVINRFESALPSANTHR